jgi:hypothetical protein
MILQIVNCVLALSAILQMTYLTNVGNGYCIIDKCICGNNYDESTHCTTCKIGYYGNECEMTSDQCNLIRCNGNGHCIDKTIGCRCYNLRSNESNCSRCIGNRDIDKHCYECKHGYYGMDCEMSSSECSLTRCNGIGLCVNRTYGCTCEREYGIGCKNYVEIVIKQKESIVPLLTEESDINIPIIPMEESSYYDHWTILIVVVAIIRMSSLYRSNRNKRTWKCLY